MDSPIEHSWMSPIGHAWFSPTQAQERGYSVYECPKETSAAGHVTVTLAHHSMLDCDSSRHILPDSKYLGLIYYHRWHPAQAKTIVENILHGRHPIMDDHGKFYDSSGNHALTIILGTNCGLYWYIHCNKCEKDNNGCSCGQYQSFRPIITDAVCNSDLLCMLNKLVEEALNLGLVYRRDITGGITPPP